MSDVAIATVERYVSENGGFCPSCEDSTKVRRLSASTEHAIGIDLKPFVKVFCCCGLCGMDWWEIYGLIGVEMT